MIDEILDEFDFERVHRAMIALQWSYHNTEGTPHIGDLRRLARSLLKQVVEAKGIQSVASGGFTAYMHSGLLGLRFEVTQFEVEVEKGIGQ